MQISFYSPNIHKISDLHNNACKKVPFEGSSSCDVFNSQKKKKKTIIEVIKNALFSKTPEQSEPEPTREDLLMRELRHLSDKKWENIYRLGLLNIPEREEQLSAYDIKDIVDDLDDKNIEKIERRNLLTYKIGDRPLSGSDISFLANINDEEWDLFNKRDLANLCKKNDTQIYDYDKVKSLYPLVLLSEEDWRTFNNRNVIGIFDSGENSFVGSEAVDCTKMSEEQFERVKELKKLDKTEDFQNENYIRYSSLDDSKYNRAKLFFKNMTHFPVYDDDIYDTDNDVFYSILNYDEKTWQNIIDKNLFDIICKKDNDICSTDFKEFAKMNSSDWNYVKKYLKSPLRYDTVLTIVNLNRGDFSISDLDVSDIKEILDDIDANESKIEDYPELKELKNSLLKSLDGPISSYEVSQKNISKFFNDVIANTKEAENDIKQADFKSYGKNGVPLKYARKDFISDMESVTKDLTQREKQKLFNKLEIEPVYDDLDGALVGYNKILNNKQLDVNNPTEKKVYDLVNKFVFENEAVSTNPHTNKIINSILAGAPEFVNIIGKQQHSAHDLSLDGHILGVLQSCISIPSYNELDNKDKTVLKMSALFHDIAKNELVVDSSHPKKSAEYSKSILSKYNFPVNTKEKICNIIENHHWLKSYNTGEWTPRITALKFRDCDDFKIAKILAEADLMNLNSYLYEAFSTALNNTEPIELDLDKINGSGNLLFTSNLINKDLIPIINENGNDYKVVNFTKINNKTDLSSVGFLPRVKKADLRFLVHMVPDYDLKGSLENVDILSKKDLGRTFSTSFLSLNSQNTYSNFKYGFVMVSKNSDIGTCSAFNQGSGQKKGFADFERITNTVNDSSRDFTKYNLTDSLKIDDKEYRKLYSLIQSYKYLTQIKDNSTFRLGKTIVKGDDLKEAITETQDKLLSNGKWSHNEVVTIAPNIVALYCKVDEFSQIPEEVKKYSLKNNVPIFITGND